MTPSERIVQAAYDVLRGDVRDEPKGAGLCIALVRVVIERAFYAGQWRFDDLHRTVIVNPRERASQDPYASDMEASLRDQGMALPLPRVLCGNDLSRYIDPTALDTAQPGTLLFRWDTAKYRNGVYVGHGGILVPGRLVLENVANRYGALQRGPTTLSRLGA